MSFIEFNVRAAETNVGGNLSERMALFLLFAEGPMPLGKLAARITLSRAALTSLADRLVGLGLVERNPCPTDRRTINLALTPVGSSSVSRVLAATDAA